MALRITSVTDGVRFDVQVQPRATRTEVVGLHGDALKVRLQAPPVDGAANAALARFLGDALGVPARNVRIVAGASGRRKVVAVQGASAADVLRLVR